MVLAWFFETCSITMATHCMFLILILRIQTGFLADHELAETPNSRLSARKNIINADSEEAPGHRVITIGEYTDVPLCNYGSCDINRTVYGIYFKPFICKCDKSCFFFGDCCYGYLNSFLGVNMFNLTKQRLQDKIQSISYGFEESGVRNDGFFMRMKQHMKCVRFSVGHSDNTYWLINSCPTNTISSPEDVLDCEKSNRTLFGSIPVTLVTNPSIIFANIHCAECHGLTEKHVRFWKTSTICRGLNKGSVSFNTLKQYISNGRCSLTIQSLSIDHPRPCSFQIQGQHLARPWVNHGNNSGPETYGRTASLCSLYWYPVVTGSSDRYKNPHCFGVHLLQNTFDLNLSKRAAPQYHSAKWQCNVLSQTTARINPTGTPAPYVGTLVVLFSFSDNSVSLQEGGKTLRSEAKVCPCKDEVYMTYKERCVKLKCNELDRKPVNGTCLLKRNLTADSQGQIYPLGSFAFFIRLHVRNDQLTEHVLNSQNILEFFMKSIRRRKQNPRLTSSIHRLEVSFSQNRTETHPVVLQTYVSLHTLANTVLEFQSLISKTNKHSEVKNIELSNFKTPYGSADNHINTFYRNIQAVNNSGCPNGSFSQLVYNSQLITLGDRLYAKSHGLFFNLENIPFQMFLNESSDILPNASDIIICLPENENDTLSCDQKIILPTNLFSLENGSLVSGELQLDPGNYSLTKDGQAVICSTFKREYIEVQVFSYDETQTILTYMTSPISMLCFMLLLLVYSVLPELRNVPGKIVMTLSLNLLLAQAMMLILNRPTGKLCTAVAILAHFTWLSGFVWMTMLSVDLVVCLWALLPKKEKKTGTLKSTFWHYACLGYGIPATFVAFCVILDHFKVRGIVVGYGKDHYCWITTKKAVLFAFVVPLLFTLLINIVCFILSLISIEHTKSMISGISKTLRNERTRLGLYIRMMFVMGMPWILTFAAAFTNVQFLWWFQIVLNDLQGVFMFICFICKPRIFKHLKMKMVPLTKKTDVNISTNRVS